MKPGWNHSVFEERVRLLMRVRKLNGLKLAAIMGMTPSNTSSYITGRFTPGVPMLLRFCKALGCSADYLLGLDNNPKLRW